VGVKKLEVLNEWDADENVFRDRDFEPFGDMDEMYEAVRQELIVWGETPVRAEVGEDGNCKICGESGRCPGWHSEEE